MAEHDGLIVGCLQQLGRALLVGALLVNATITALRRRRQIRTALELAEELRHSL